MPQRGYFNDDALLFVLLSDGNDKVGGGFTVDFSTSNVK